ncbi:response regulator [Chitinophaga sp. NPDC101104]|uniref:response regulator n=1 Tax=Chitinophaga sp. NPDC101104 TaxID=3390561 RepID=UPI003D01D909
MKIKLFIVDDHYMVIEGIRSLLQQEPSIEWLGHATNAASCISFLAQQQPDVILMDINLPDKSGIELCREVRSKYPGCNVLGLSTFNQHAVIRDMIDNGASGYLLKNAGKQELMEAIQLAARGKTYMSHEASTSLKDSAHQIPVITRRENEILKLIAAGLTNAAIAEKLFISIPTVNTHRKSLLEKFNAKNTAILIGKAAKMGLINVE